jgi:hypothetical protein
MLWNPLALSSECFLWMLCARLVADSPGEDAKIVFVVCSDYLRMWLANRPSSDLSTISRGRVEAVGLYN